MARSARGASRVVLESSPVRESWGSAEHVRALRNSARGRLARALSIALSIVISIVLVVVSRVSRAPSRAAHRET